MLWSFYYPKNKGKSNTKITLPKIKIYGNYLLYYHFPVAGVVAIEAPPRPSGETVNNTSVSLSSS